MTLLFHRDYLSMHFIEHNIVDAVDADIVLGRGIKLNKWL